MGIKKTRRFNESIYPANVLNDAIEKVLEKRLNRFLKNLKNTPDRRSGECTSRGAHDSNHCHPDFE